MDLIGRWVTLHNAVAPAGNASAILDQLAVQFRDNSRATQLAKKLAQFDEVKGNFLNANVAEWALWFHEFWPEPARSARSAHEAALQARTCNAFGQEVYQTVIAMSNNQTQNPDVSLLRTVCT